ncbi:hypothetical protein PGT21_015979 [Puccinia graminis f. sp. tritici]|uniref:Uncharacterized protein n=1 Tax=Puccinia graminis f. sp. tritici TaxID=56615 RepID=A0A5B0QZB5_PUCGR|nr:hypothetical protein PGT21_015979 [Puccinia graminis f. sp. tritici]KAA1118638.1 hypothetical protein PGTUg99_009099 [Puccinia graminis f. sp. tritici]
MRVCCAAAKARQNTENAVNDKDDIQIISESNKAERLRDEATAKFLEKALKAEGEGDKARSDMFYNLYAAAERLKEEIQSFNAQL